MFESIELYDINLTDPVELIGCRRAKMQRFYVFL